MKGSSRTDLARAHQLSVEIKGPVVDLKNITEGRVAVVSSVSYSQIIIT